MEDGTDCDETLPATGVFATLSEDVREQLTAAGQFETLPEGKYLHIQGEFPDAMFFIISGEVGVKSHANAETIELATLGAGATVGEMGMIDPRPASANVRTSTETRLWRISHEDFEAFLEANHSNGYAMMRALAKELCQRIRRDTERSLRDAHRQHDASYDADY